MEPGEGHYLGCFLDAIRRRYGLERWLIRSRRCERQGPLLRLEVVQRLSSDFDYAFRETRLIEESRKATGLEQPARYGKEGVPVFALTEAILKGDWVASPRAPSSDPLPVFHPQLPPDIEFLRSRYPAPRDPGTITRVHLPPSICVTRKGGD